MSRIAIAGLLVVCLTVAAVTTQKKTVQPKPGVTEVQVPFTSLHPSAALKIGRTADWVLVTDDAIWVTSTKPYSLQRIDPATNTVVAKVRLPGAACSASAFGFDSVWVPVCGKKPLLARVDAHTNRITSVLPIGPGGPTRNGECVIGSSLRLSLRQEDGYFRRVLRSDRKRSRRGPNGVCDLHATRV